MSNKLVPIMIPIILKLRGKNRYLVSPPVIGKIVPARPKIILKEIELENSLRLNLASVPVRSR